MMGTNNKTSQLSSSSQNEGLIFEQFLKDEEFLEKLRPYRDGFIEMLKVYRKAYDSNCPSETDEDFCFDDVLNVTQRILSAAQDLMKQISTAENLSMQISLTHREFTSMLYYLEKLTPLI